METICYRVWLLGVGLCVSFPGLLEPSPIYLGGLKDGRFFFFGHTKWHGGSSPAALNLRPLYRKLGALTPEPPGKSKTEEIDPLTVLEPTSLKWRCWQRRAVSETSREGPSLV